MYEHLAVLALFIFAYGAVAGGIERTWISGPMLYTGFGLLLGPYGLNVFSLEADPGLISSLAELTLALVLFHDAAGANLAVLKKASGLPVRLLLVGLPLTILLGYVVGTWLPLGLGALELALLATMLAPTDAALGKPVVTNEVVPADIREGLNVESGLNDGICVPILFIFLALMTGAEGADEPWHLALSLVAREIGIGLLTGLALSALGFWILRTVHRKGWITKSWATLTIASLAVCCFAVGQWLGGSGFIASFSGGLLFGGLLRKHKQQLLAEAEGIGDTLALITWVMFGSAVVGQAVGHFSWPVILYAALSLTVVRMLPVFLVLTSSGLSVEGKLFAGWFGPRGLASIVFAVIVLDSGVPGAGAIAMVVVCTVILSIMAHGLTGDPWATAFGRRAARRS